jgi:hypothetical protein
MEYSILLLGVLGMLGILLHNLVKMNDINKKAKGAFNFGQYLAIEKFSIMISLIVVVVCLITYNDIKQLHDLGIKGGLGFFTIGYMSQSLLVKFTGQAEKFLKEKGE